MKLHCFSNSFASKYKFPTEQLLARLIIIRMEIPVNVTVYKKGSTVTTGYLSLVNFEFFYLSIPIRVNISGQSTLEPACLLFSEILQLHLLNTETTGLYDNANMMDISKIEIPCMAARKNTNESTCNK